MLAIGVVLLPAALVLYTFSTFLLSLVFGFTSVSIVLGLLPAIVLSVLIGKHIKSLIRDCAQLPIIVVWISAFFLLYPLFRSHSFMPTAAGWVSGGGAWGDYAWHSTVIHHFAQRETISLEHPLLAGHAITYPFLIDFFSAILLRAGFSIQLALLVPGLLLASNLVALVFVVTRQITKHSLPALVAILLFFFNGGLGWWFAIGDFLNSGMPFTQWIGTLNASYTFNGGLNIFFSNIIADYLIPQRPILLGLSLGIIILWLFWEGAHMAERKRRKVLFMLGFLAGLLPFVHQHTFLSLAILLPLLTICTPLLLARFDPARRARGRLVDIFVIGVPVILTALPQLFWYMTHLQTERYFKFVIGWMAEGEALQIFWWKNLGLFLPIAAVATGLAPTKARWFLMPFWFLFILTNVVQFQPYNYDNMKLMLFWLLAMSIAISVLFFRVALRIPRNLRLPMLAAVLFALTASGILTVIRESDQQWVLYDHEAIALAQWVKANTRPHDRFLTSDAHNHPVPGLTGRPIVLGYKGWLWSHGLDYQQQESDVSHMFRLAPDAPSLLAKYKVSYVAIGPSERSALANPDVWERSDYPVVYRTAHYVLYRITL